MRVFKWFLDHWEAIVSVLGLTGASIVWLTTTGWLWPAIAIIGFTAGMPLGIWLDSLFRKLSKKVFFAAQPSKVAELLMQLRHCAKRLGKIVDTSFIYNIRTVQDEFNKTAVEKLDTRLVAETMNAWWVESVAPKLEVAATSGDPEEWKAAVALLNSYDNQIHQCWKNVILNTQTSAATKHFNEAYEDAIGGVRDVLAVLESNDWSFKWYKRGKFF